MVTQSIKSCTIQYINSTRTNATHPTEYHPLKDLPCAKSKNRYPLSKQIIVNNGHLWNGTTHLVFGVQIDTINFTQIANQNEPLFCLLEQCPNSSPLIRHFAECERNKEPLTDPETGEILMKLNRFHGIPVNGIVPNPTYQLNGGFSEFARIREIDPKFYECICWAIDNTNWLQCSRIDLFQDTTAPLMETISEGMKFGKYWCPNAQPFAIGTLNNVPLKDNIGKYSECGALIKDKELKIETLYIGDRRTCPISVCIYDKASQQLAQKQELAYAQSRIEVRLNFEKGASDVLSNNMIKKILTNYDSPEIMCYLVEFFMTHVTQKIQFTTNKFVPKDKEVKEILADWWVALFHSPLQRLHASLQKLKGWAFDKIQKLFRDNLLEDIVEMELFSNPPGRPKGKADSCKRNRRTQEEINNNVPNVPNKVLEQLIFFYENVHKNKDLTSRATSFFSKNEKTLFPEKPNGFLKKQ